MYFVQTHITNDDKFKESACDYHADMQTGTTLDLLTNFD